ncbi:MAG: arylesterase/paraoxonase [Bacteroidia bacterium]|jgi:arylesterase/paraoxonase
MPLAKKALLLVLILLAGFVLYTFISTGFFRTVENSFEGEVIKEIALKGAEDITISYTDSFALISATAKLQFPPIGQEHGGLYLMELKSGDFVVKHLTADFALPFAPHGISMLKTNSTYTVAVVNHTVEGHTIEFFSLYDEKLTHIRTQKSTSLISPNDIVLLDEKRFYVTNDHGYEHGTGRLVEEYGNLAISNVVYFDGQDYSEAAGGISFANGINIDRERNLVFVASPRRFLVKVYESNDDGTLAFIEDIPCGTGVDNIEFDTEGNLWIGCHPNLLRFTAYAKGKKETTPSELLRITYRSKGDFSVESVYTNDGSTLSGSTVAAPFGDLLLVGTVKDDKMLILRL